jgi:hypothetical protein
MAANIFLQRWEKVNVVTKMKEVNAVMAVKETGALLFPICTSAGTHSSV